MITLIAALKLIRETQARANSFGYHICLGGGVLNKGRSGKDLDLYFHPLLGMEQQNDGLLQSLEIGWGPSDSNAFSGGDDNGPYCMKLRFLATHNNQLPGTVEVFII